MSKARPCAFCGMPYVEPCDGQNHKCGNYPLAEARHNHDRPIADEDPLRLGPTPRVPSSPVTPR